MEPAQLARSMTWLVVDASGVFRQMGGADWARARGSGTWTRLEILGHLIDSAMNNHQRFVRAIAQGQLEFPGYDQEAMVRVQHFGSAPPPMLIALWESLNLYLTRVISLIPQDKRNAPCAIGGNEPVTLEFLAADYVAHMQHHLRQIFEGMSVSIRWVDIR